MGAGGGVTGAGGGVDGLACWKKLNAGGAAFFFTGFFSSATGAGGGVGLALLVPKKSVRASVMALDEAIGGTLGGGVTAFGSGFLTTGLGFGVLAPKMFANGDEASFLGAGGFTTGAAFLTTGAAFLTTGAACLATGAVKQE